MRKDALGRFLVAKSLNRTNLLMFPSITFFVIFYLDIDTYLVNEVSEIIKPKYLYIVSYILGILSLFNLRKKLLSSSTIIFAIFFAYYATLLLWRAISGDDAGPGSPLRVYTYSLFLFISFFLIFQDEKIALYARYALLFSICFAMFVNFVELFYPGILSINAGQSAGFYIDPNKTGLALNAALPLVIGLLPLRARPIFWIPFLAAVFVTLSRSGIIISALLGLVLLIRGVIRFKGVRITSVAVFLVLLAGYYASYSTVPAVRKVFDAKIGYVGMRVVTKIQSGNGTEIEKTGGEESIAKRLAIMGRAGQAILENPITGIGVDRAGDLGTHNVYLRHALNFGMVGWFIVPALAFLLVRYGNRDVTLPVATGLLAAGFFTSSSLSFTPSVTTLALAAALCVQEKRRLNKTVDG